MFANMKQFSLQLHFRYFRHVTFTVLIPVLTCLSCRTLRLRSLCFRSSAVPFLFSLLYIVLTFGVSCASRRVVSACTCMTIVQ
jgi:hypothetical protein